MSIPTIRLAKNYDEKRWDEYVNQHQNASPYHLFSWCKAVVASYRFSNFSLLAEENSNIIGIFPIIKVKSIVGNSYYISLPYCDVAGILTNSDDMSQYFFKYLRQYIDKNSVEIRKNDEKITNECVNHKNKVRMVLELPGCSEILFNSFKSKLRSQIRKPIRDKLSCHIGNMELLDQFYGIYSENMRDLGSLVHPKKWFYNVLRYYDNRAKCCVVYLPDSTPAAAGIILCNDHTVSIPWASSLRRFNSMNPNMLLYWTLLQFATDNGHKYFDFGRSSFGEGTYIFKKQWGAKPYSLSWTMNNLNNGKMHSVNNKTKSFELKRDIIEHFFQKMPVAVSTFLGSRIRKYVYL